MISMRYHIVSLAAIFLALALGIVLGATKISSPILSGLQSDKTDLSSQNTQLSSDNTSLTARVASDDKFASSVGNLAVRGTLPNATVVLITTSDADPGDRDAVLSLLARAGAKVTAQIQLTANFSDPSHADDLRTLAARVLPTGAKLPAVSQVGAVAGGLLASVLLTDKDGKATAPAAQATSALSALASGGFLQASGTVVPGRLVVVLTGGAVTGGSEADRAAAIGDMAAQLKTAAGGVVVAGRSGSEAATGTVGVVRANTAESAVVSTVDDVDTSSGRLAAVLALVEQNGGGVGRYGFASSAQAQIPTLGVG
ncbi:Copper transport outer membrane protein, MctB [Nakamurella panacisegetis]|uniref:Copper transport outer membrane protein, MctB n=1 Tax=Nakamurella panacisegetis TaxID=1090615 RepID=A0A1H0PT57_9ACTN|nr:copper transporter [Nakamurella panacisegetis]SDP07719.1 Copper transport outer membrane protein, MctB [Nakamurella panacisegetis]